MTSLHRRALLRNAGLAALLLLAGCLYSFTGGGLPRHIRTIAVVPFENATPEALIGTELQIELQEELPRKLGVRLVDESVADAVIRGRIVSVLQTEPNVRPVQGQSRAEVVQREVRITIAAEIYDRTEERSIWEATSLSGLGAYQPDRGDFTAGKTLAIEDLARKIIDGAQSQW